jgi:anaerobic magnesium-protoporphyrin IX monomethyl ester cyclase
MPVALRHDPWFVIKNAPKMFADTFRGSRLKTFLGLEDEREAFKRYRALRKIERAYI